jgi:nitroreductase
MKYNLSEITDLIRTRRSIMPEKYSPRKVHKEQIELILTNGTWAPSHGMTQPWRFKVFMADGLKKLAVFLPELYQLNTKPEAFNQAKADRFRTRAESVSVIIAVCMERDKTGKIRELEEVEAVACAVQNMSLTATAYGLGSFWSTPGFIYTPEMNQFLGMEDQDKCLGLFYLGYSSDEWPASHRKPLEYVTTWIED